MTRRNTGWNFIYFYKSGMKIGIELRLSLLLALATVAAAQTSAGHPHLNGTYVATSYSQTGITASGEWTHRHVVAADPDLLPLGTRVLRKNPIRI
jgi:hypothetical protein